MDIGYFTHLITLCLKVSWLLKKLDWRFEILFWEIETHIKMFKEKNLETHIQNMRKNRILRASLEIMTFSDLMRLNIRIYTSLDQQEPEKEINHPHNSGIICILLRNCRHYEGLENMITRK